MGLAYATCLIQLNNGTLSIESHRRPGHHRYHLAGPKRFPGRVANGAALTGSGAAPLTISKLSTMAFPLMLPGGTGGDEEGIVASEAREMPVWSFTEANTGSEGE
jgi:hypothetical protein